MGKIFGISDLPVSTIMSPFEQIKILNPVWVEKPNAKYGELEGVDVFVGKTSKQKTSKFLDMRNGFGKLMKSFSKVQK